MFSVDIQDGVPPLKLPYNVTEDPWFAAQNFIHKNNLPQAYLEQVANFIVTNSKKSQQLAGPSNTASSEFFDPFTGEFYEILRWIHKEINITLLLNVETKPFQRISFL